MSFANEGICLSIQYESHLKELDNELTIFLLKQGFPEYIAKIQQTSTSFPTGYKRYKTWFNIAKKNKVDSILMSWLKMNAKNR
jgi:hypothetical protein